MSVGVGSGVTGVLSGVVKETVGDGTGAGSVESLVGLGTGTDADTVIEKETPPVESVVGMGIGTGTSLVVLGGGTESVAEGCDD